MRVDEVLTEGWSQKYKSSINCSHPKGFSQRAHCAGKKKHNESVEMEMVCEDCGMCQTHGNLNEIKKGQKDANGYTRCWPGKHAEGTKRGKNGGQVRNCVPNESVAESEDQEDYEIRNLEKLDNIMVILCRMVIEGQQEDGSHFGLVAAGVLDPDNNLVAEVNYPHEDGLRVHAERAAMDAYVEKYGDIPDGSIIITTLSPCSEHNDFTGQNRYGESCTDLINNSNIHKVYCGYMDPSQGDDKHDERGFTLQETNNQQVRGLCKKFADTFLKDEVDESAAWHRKAGKNKTGGLNRKGVMSYRREHPGSKLQTAVTTKPSKLKAGSKAAKRRKSFCARMSGVKGPMKKPNGKPTRKALALRKWNC